MFIVVIQSVSVVCWKTCFDAFHISAFDLLSFRRLYNDSGVLLIAHSDANRHVSDRKLLCAQVQFSKATSVKRTFGFEAHGLLKHRLSHVVGRLKH